jgi:hypothetical protein
MLNSRGWETMDPAGWIDHDCLYNVGTVYGTVVVDTGGSAGFSTFYRQS